MSITYPEAQPTRASKAAPAAAGGSALFPGGAANLYDRARSPRSGKGAGFSPAWIAAPVAVVLIGGAIALGVPHHGAQTATAARTTTTTTTAAAPLAQASTPSAAPVKAEAAPPAMPGKTVTQATTLRSGTAPAPVHSARASTSRSVTRSTTAEALPSAPMAYSQASGGDQTAAPAPAQSAPVQSAPAQAAAPAASTATPGNFAFTAPATGPGGAAPVAATPTTSSAPASGGQATPSTTAPPSPQG